MTALELQLELHALKSGWEKNKNSIQELNERTEKMKSDLEDLKKWAESLPKPRVNFI